MLLNWWKTFWCGPTSTCLSSPHIADELQENIDEIAHLVSNHLIQTSSLLSNLAASNGPSQPKQLTAQLRDMIDDIERSQRHLNGSRISLSNSTSKTLQLYQNLLEATVRRLEQVIHGSVARGTRSQAEYLAHVADGLDKKLRIMEIQVMQQVYPPEVREALEAREQELAKENASLKRRVRELERVKEDHEMDKGMRRIAENYMEVQREIEKVRDETGRLQSR